MTPLVEEGAFFYFSSAGRLKSFCWVTLTRYRQSSFCHMLSLGPLYSKRPGKSKGEKRSLHSDMIPSAQQMRPVRQVQPRKKIRQPPSFIRTDAVCVKLPYFSPLTSPCMHVFPRAVSKRAKEQHETNG